jgi:hypothetical protein
MEEIKDVNFTHAELAVISCLIEDEIDRVEVRLIDTSLPERRRETLKARLERLCSAQEKIFK